MTTKQAILTWGVPADATSFNKYDGPITITHPRSTPPEYKFYEDIFKTDASSGFTIKPRNAIPVLTVTSKGEFNWAPDAEERLTVTEEHSEFEPGMRRMLLRLLDYEKIINIVKPSL